jgi:hypothetical protein
MTNEKKNKYYRYIIKSINSENYDVVTKGRKEKLQFLSDTFKKEMGWNIERIGQGKAFEEWIMELPTVFNIVFSNYDILNLAKRLGSLSTRATDKQQNRILENYWNFITSLTFQLFRKYNIK